MLAYLGTSRTAGPDQSVVSWVTELSLEVPKPFDAKAIYVFPILKVEQRKRSSQSLVLQDGHGLFLV